MNFKGKLSKTLKVVLPVLLAIIMLVPVIAVASGVGGGSNGRQGWIESICFNPTQVNYWVLG